MNPELEVQGGWSARRWVALVVLILLVQLGFIFWLGERKTVTPRTPRPAPAFRMAGESSAEWLELTDPTLFALPNGRSFSGRAWLSPYSPPYAGFRWDEEPRWLALPAEQLGAAFSRLVETNTTTEWLRTPVPEPRFASLLTTRQPISVPSTVHVHGDLAQRRLVSRLTLPAWPGRPSGPNETDLLTNTVVQVVVDSEGRPVSATLLKSSGLKAADDFALRQAPGLRFEPTAQRGASQGKNVSSILGGLTWGQLVFQWQTILSP